MNTRMLFLGLGIFSVACGGQALQEKSDSDSPLGIAVTQALKTDCPNGGVVINQGIDRNGNGKIDQNEITSSETVCNGEDGSSCTVADNGNGTKTISCGSGTSVTIHDGTNGKNIGVAVTPEPAGTNCSAGGKKYTTFFDTNSNGIQDVGESILNTSYICNGENFDLNMQRTLSLVVPKAVNAVLDIECTDGVNSGRGTGTKAYSNAIITAAHVVAGMTSCIYYKGNTAVASGGTIAYSALGRDLAMIINPNPGNTWSSIERIPPVSIDPTTLYIGQMLLLVSYPLDIVNDRQYTFGFITDDNVDNSLTGSYSTLWDDAFTTDMAAAAGSSGGPVFDEEGKFIAIHVGGYGSEGLELNYTLPLKNGDFVW